MQIIGTTENAKKTSPKMVMKFFDTSLHNDRCNHRPKIVFCMSQAPEASKLPVLIGVSRVCHGVYRHLRRDFKHHNHLSSHLNWFEELAFKLLSFMEYKTYGIINENLFLCIRKAA